MCIGVGVSSKKFYTQLIIISCYGRCYCHYCFAREVSVIIDHKPLAAILMSNVALLTLIHIAKYPPIQDWHTYINKALTYIQLAGYQERIMLKTKMKTQKG